MLRQAKNRVRIEGILSEIDLKYGSLMKNGKPIDTIGGHIKVLVDREIGGEIQRNEIPVHMFAYKLKNNGDPNPAYTSIETVMNEYVSIAAAGGETGADKVRITGAQLSMNEYYNQNGQLISFPRIRASFASKAIGEFKPEASFELEVAVSNIAYEVDADGIEVEPKRLNVTAILPQYGEKIDIIKLVATTPNVIDGINSCWEKDQSYAVIGRLNFTSKTETIVEEIGFGEPVTKSRTTNVSDLVITGGSQEPLEGDAGFDVDDIIKAMAERKQRLEELKNKNKGKGTPVSLEQASKKSIAEAGMDLGF